MSKPALVPLLMLLLWSMTAHPRAAACPSDGGTCRDCIADRLNYGCPSCGPVLRCMGRCMWGGSSRAQCTRRCDCDGDGGKRKLSGCKKCMSKCKCSCVA